jgi:hypothetical protein
MCLRMLLRLRERILELVRHQPAMGAKAAIDRLAGDDAARRYADAEAAGCRGGRTCRPNGRSRRMQGADGVYLQGVDDPHGDRRINRPAPGPLAAPCVSLIWRLESVT